MKINNKIILSLGLGAMLATAGLASSSYDKNQIRIEKVHHKGSPIIHKVMKLDLTKKQRENIDIILKELRDSIKHPTEAFTKSSFNKDVFVKILEQKKSSKIVNEAQAIEKIYKLLDITQKKHLKTILDMDEIKHLNKGRK